MDTTEAGRPSPFIFLSDNNRSVRKSRHVESGPPEFATAVDNTVRSKKKLGILKAARTDFGWPTDGRFAFLKHLQKFILRNWRC